MDLRRLPPLSSLRAFEAAARLGSFSAAGRELNVTHAAVAQQVRGLEERLGLALMRRQGRGLEMTEAGKRLGDTLSESFTRMAATLDDLARLERERPLRVTMSPGFASHWLMPRLGRFWAGHPEIALAIHSDARLVDLVADDMDLGIRLGTGDWPGLEVSLLSRAWLVVVGAPSLLAGRQALSPAEMADLPWVLDEFWGERAVILRDLGLDPDKLRSHSVPNDDLALSAAIAGHGLHIELDPLVEAHADAGQLVVVHRLGPSERMGYHLVTRPGPRRAELQAFMDWLRRELGEQS